MEEDFKPDDESGDDRSIVIIPIRSSQNATNLTPDNVDDVVSNETRIIRNIISGESSSGTSGSNPYSSSDITFVTPSDNPTETSSQISDYLSQSQEVTEEEQQAITCAAQCGAFFKSLGAETLIYFTSYGSGQLVNGLLIRFAGLHPLVGTLIFGSTAALSYHSCRVLFTSLIKPPKEKLPDDKKACYEIMKKYSFLPVSWILRAGAAGGILSWLGDSDFGTQQAIAVPSSLLVGPIQAGIARLTLSCFGGDVDVDPNYTNFDTPGRAFRTMTSTNPNPLDDDRPYRFGYARDILLRFVTMNTSTLAFYLAGGTQLVTYCWGNPEGYLNETSNPNVTNVNEALNGNCFGGQMVFGFRELAFSLAYGVGVLVIEPLLAKAINAIFGCFYQHEDESSDDSGQIEEVSSDDSDSYNEV